MAIFNMSGGGKSLKAYTQDATATSDDIVSGKTAYVNGEKVVGTRETQYIVTVNNNLETEVVTHYCHLSNGEAVSYTINSGASIPIAIAPYGMLVFVVSGTAYITVTGSNEDVTALLIKSGVYALGITNTTTVTLNASSS